MKRHFYIYLGKNNPTEFLIENWEEAVELVFQYVSQDRYKDSAVIYVAGVQLPRVSYNYKMVANKL